MHLYSLKKCVEKQNGLKRKQKGAWVLNYRVHTISFSTYGGFSDIIKTVKPERKNDGNHKSGQKAQIKKGGM